MLPSTIAVPRPAPRLASLLPASAQLTPPHRLMRLSTPPATSRTPLLPPPPDCPLPHSWHVAATSGAFGRQRAQQMKGLPGEHCPLRPIGWGGTWCAWGFPTGTVVLLGRRRRRHRELGGKIRRSCPSLLQVLLRCGARYGRRLLFGFLLRVQEPGSPRCPHGCRRT